MNWKGTNQRSELRALQILSLRNFYFWGCIKDRVFATSSTDVDEPKTRIQADVCNVTEDLLKNTWRELEYLSEIIRAAKGDHAEIYWGTLSYNKKI